MEKNMRENFRMIINMVMEHIIGEMEGNIRAIGKIINNMELESIQMPKEWRKKENGTMGRESDGWNK